MTTTLNLEFGRIPEDEEKDTIIFGANAMFFGRIVGSPGLPAEEAAKQIAVACRSQPKLKREIESFVYSPGYIDRLGHEELRTLLNEISDNAQKALDNIEEIAKHWQSDH